MAKEIAVSEAAWEAAIATNRELALDPNQENPDDYRLRIEIAAAVIETVRLKIVPITSFDVALMSIALTCLSVGAIAARLEREPAPSGL